MECNFEENGTINVKLYKEMYLDTLELKGIKNEEQEESRGEN